VPDHDLTPLANFDLTAALDYYGSDRAREDFLAGREEPEELLKNSKANNANGRNTSVVDHLFESQGGRPAAKDSHRSGRISERHQGRPTGQNKIGHVSHIVREVPVNVEAPKHVMVDNQRNKLLSKLGIRK
jgi:hypothetical protein